ncbi:MAG: hypothetical protein WDA06_01910 [Phenylobacterium sp.]
MTIISIKLDDRQVKHLKKMTHYLSLDRDEDLTFSDLIREAINNTFPMPLNEEQENES